MLLAMPETILQRWNEMTPDEQKQTTIFIDFLLMRREKRKKTHFELGALKGGLVYIADDFDKTPEEFEEYM